jgi:hypothetical protein
VNEMPGGSLEAPMDAPMDPTTAGRVYALGRPPGRRWYVPRVSTFVRLRWASGGGGFTHSEAATGENGDASPGVEDDVN